MPLVRRRRITERVRYDADPSCQACARVAIHGYGWCGVCHACYMVKNKDRRYLMQAKARYGISAQDYYELLELQKHRCAICHTHEDKLGERLCVDHCHRTGDVRGLLCAGCNKMLGFHEKRNTGAWSHYTVSPPMKELKYRRETPDDEQVHPY